MKKFPLDEEAAMNPIQEYEYPFSCVRKALSNGTDEYTLRLYITGIDDEAPDHQFVRFTVNSEYQQVFHFFKWEYWNIWSFKEDVPISYSKLKGFVTPQMVTKSNQNITSAFRGPESSKLYFRLTPTHYGNEIESQTFQGYQVFLDKYDRGSVVTKRNMASKITESGKPSKGLNIEMETSTGETLIHVQVQKTKNFLEVLAYILGFIAGFVLVSHALKYFLSNEEYFLGLDRE